MYSGSGQTAVAPLLWASSVSAGGGTLRLAEVVAMRMAGRIDWDGRTSLQETQAQSLRDARAVAGAVLGPVTPTRGDEAARAPASVPEVLELQGDPEVLFLQGRDHRLKVVPLLARHADLVALGL